MRAKVENLSQAQVALLGTAYREPLRWIWYPAARSSGRLQALLRLERRGLMYSNGGYTSRITKRGVRAYAAWLKRHHLTHLLRRAA